VPWRLHFLVILPEWRNRWTQGTKTSCVLVGCMAKSLHDNTTASMWHSAIAKIRPPHTCELVRGGYRFLTAPLR